MTPKAMDDIIETITGLLPRVPDELKKTLRAGLIATFDRLNLVTREELEVQEAVLQRTRERLAEMEKRVAELEAKSRK